MKIKTNQISKVNNQVYQCHRQTDENLP